MFCIFSAFSVYIYSYTRFLNYIYMVILTSQSSGIRGRWKYAYSYDLILYEMGISSFVNTSSL